MSQAFLIHHGIKNLPYHECKIKCLLLEDLGVVFYTAVLQQKLIKQPCSLLETIKKKKLVIVASNEEYEFEVLKHPDTINIYVPVGLKTK